MHIRKYDFDFSRRHFINQSLRGVFGAGVLMPVWDAVAANGEFAAAYPDELLSIEAYTKGRMKSGDVIDASNAELVRDLLDPIRYMQIMQMGRRLEIVPSTTDMTKLSPVDYIEATLRNKGKAHFDATGNVVVEGGKPWIGGNPFPEPTNGVEIFAGITLTWGRHDVSFYPVNEFEVNAQGDIDYTYQLCWTELAPVGRVSIDPKPYWPGHEDKLRYQSVFFVYPQDSIGTVFLNIWPYDQTQFPELMGYLPQFKRVRQFPTDQRFEPLIPGSTLYFSDAWAAGDPFLTWGNYKIVHRGPFLTGLTENWNAGHENWEHTTHGGPKGNTFWDTRVELIPEAIVVDAEPVKYPRAPVSRKRVWFDARTLLPVGMVSYDRRGDPFKSFDGSYSLYELGDKRVMDRDRPYWSWCHVHAHDVQSNRLTRLEQVKTVRGGFEMSVNDQGLYERYLTTAALRRLGR